MSACVRACVCARVYVCLRATPPPPLTLTITHSLTRTHAHKAAPHLHELLQKLVAVLGHVEGGEFENIQGLH